ncbi:MAG: mechanosensitive ion channel, partial [Clostridia bacterium]|nr:mechanosensitive ion channel [Clostridia bacterium]
MTELWQEIVAFFAAWGEKWPQIVIGIVLFLLFALLSKKLTELIGAIIRKLFTRWPKTGEDIFGALKNPLRVFFVILGVELAFLIISPETKWMTFIDKLFRMANISLIAWVLLNYTPAATRQIIRFNDEKNVNQSEVAIRFMAVILRIVIVSLLAVILISEMGYNINGIIAGLGLSGLTLSLAAQNTASNLFSGFEIITDKPFDVGDYIATASAEGFVEDITMRSTRVRTRDDLVVTIPNATLMKEAITN